MELLNVKVVLKHIRLHLWEIWLRAQKTTNTVKTRKILQERSTVLVARFHTMSVMAWQKACFAFWCLVTFQETKVKGEGWTNFSCRRNVKEI